MRSAFFRTCGIVKDANGGRRLLFVFVLLTLQHGSIVSASSGGPCKSLARKNKHTKGGKKPWD